MEHSSSSLVSGQDSTLTVVGGNSSDLLAKLSAETAQALALSEPKPFRIRISGDVHDTSFEVFKMNLEHMGIQESLGRPVRVENRRALSLDKLVRPDEEGFDLTIVDNAHLFADLPGFARFQNQCGHRLICASVYPELLTELGFHLGILTLEMPYRVQMLSAVIKRFLSDFESPPAPKIFSALVCGDNVHGLQEMLMPVLSSSPLKDTGAELDLVFAPSTRNPDYLKSVICDARHDFVFVLNAFNFKEAFDQFYLDFYAETRKPMILCSAYSPAVRSFRPKASFPVLDMPFSIATLHESIRNVLAPQKHLNGN